MPDKTAYHPDGIHSIRFNEYRHTYTDNYGVKYTSGTKFVGQFFPKFDAVSVSKMCAAGNNPKYADRSPEDIQAEWSVNGRQASDEGTNIHEYAEGLISGWDVKFLPRPMTDRCRAMYPHIKSIVARLLNLYQFIAAELIIFSPEWRLSGMIDLLMWDPATKAVLILDWKTNKDAPADTGSRQTGFPPLEHLPDNKLNHYRLQLALYRKIIEKEKYFPGVSNFRQGLIHLSPEKYTTIPLEYYEYEIMEALKIHAKKQHR